MLLLARRFCLQEDLSISLSVYLSIYLSIYLYIYIYIHIQVTGARIENGAFCKKFDEATSNDDAVILMQEHKNNSCVKHVKQ